MKIIKLLNYEDINQYANIFAEKIGYKIPETYFYNENVWVVKEGKLNNDISSGFAIINKSIPRTLQQIKNIKIINLYKNKVSEITGYFIINQKGSFKLTFRLIVEIIKNEKKWFIYSYSQNNRKLEKYYAIGNPKRIWSGIPRKLEGHLDEMEIENIEILDKIGIIKIFLNRTFTKLFIRG